VADYRNLIDDIAPLINDVQEARGLGWKRPYNSFLDPLLK